MATPLSPASPAPTDTSSTLRQKEQLRRFWYPSLASTESLPLLLPLSESQKKDEAWIRLDVECQLLLAQAIRIAIQPWYSKLTNDRQLYEEIVRVVAFDLQRVKASLFQKDGNLTRIERFVLYQIPSLLQPHYIEVRRAATLGQCRKRYEGVNTAASIFLASNPHPALSITTQSQLHIDEEYLDLLLLAILQGVLPPDHLESHNETLLLIDVIKGIFRGQVHVHGSGAWVVVRALLSFLGRRDLIIQDDSTSLHTPSATKRWYHQASVKKGLDFVYGVLKTLFTYLAIFYLDLFTPLAEPRKRSNRRKGAGTESSIGWDLNPILDVIVEALLRRNRITTCIVDIWLRIGLAWGGSRLIERQVKGTLIEWADPERMRDYLARVHKMLIDMPRRPPPDPIDEPSLATQKQDYARLIASLLLRLQRYAPVALLFGHDKSTQRQSIEDALLPFLAPSNDSTCTSLVQVANARLLISLLECFATLVNPSLEC